MATPPLEEPELLDEAELPEELELPDELEELELLLDELDVLPPELELLPDDELLLPPGGLDPPPDDPPPQALIDRHISKVEKIFNGDDTPPLRERLATDPSLQLPVSELICVKA
ncbi:hypothetical protein ACNKU7_16410 [Microbulbifer sp. SA54]|uniref:hypothetical protein n=1 Tax=Microbulbifer sp. SA54 TaxID=3401577 RepID=UPI003AB0CCDE